MNTPAHAVINLALLEKRAPEGSTWPILLGAVLPDLPIFVFYVYDRAVAGRAESVVWSHDYFVSAWQPVIDALHSFPLVLLALVAAWRLKAFRAVAFSLSLLLHAVCDFLLHNDDAHRQLFPFSDYRFRSPVSYWDPRYHGALGALFELAAVVLASAVLARRHRSLAARITLALLVIASTAFYVRFYVVG